MKPDVEMLARLLAEATPSLPWKAEPCEYDPPDRSDGIEDANGNSVVVTDSGVYEPNWPTAQLIVAAVNALPALLARVAELERAVDRVARLDDNADDGYSCVFCQVPVRFGGNKETPHHESCTLVAARALMEGG